jgi:uncharacterized protein (DUF1778 family)
VEEVYLMAFKDKAKETMYKNEYTRNKYDRLGITPTKEEGQQIRQAAAAAGQSVSAFILQAVRDRMEAGR